MSVKFNKFMINKRKMYKHIHDDRCKYFLKEGLSVTTGINYDDHEISKRYRKYKNKITIPWIDVRITDACTLKCKHCTEWNPFMKSNKIFAPEQVIQELEKIMEYVDYIFGISLIGGESLVNINIDEILEYCIKNEKIGYILITTNGTLMPNKNTLEKLKSKKVKTTLSRYDESKNENYLKLLDFLINHNCNYFIYDCSQRFVDLGMPRGLQREPVQDTYDKYIDCWLRHCCHLAEGRLYRCSRTYAGIKMGLFAKEDVQNEIIDINSIYSKKQCRKIFRRFYSLPYLNTCTACSSKNERKIYKTAIQVDGE